MVENAGCFLFAGDAPHSSMQLRGGAYSATPLIFQTEADTTSNVKYVTFETDDTLSKSTSGLVYYQYGGEDEEAFDEVIGEADTLAGLLLEIKGEFPSLHEKVSFGRYEFEVLEMDNRRILRVKFTLLPNPSDSHASAAAS